MDNTTLPGTGDVIATDDIGGVKHQRVKVGFGADGVYGDVSPENPLPSADAIGQATLAQLELLNTNIQYLMNAMLAKMPQVSRTGLMRVSVVGEGSNNELSSANFGVSTNFVGESNSGRQASRMLEPWQFSDAGATRLYDKITTS